MIFSANGPLLLLILASIIALRFLKRERIAAFGTLAGRTWRATPLKKKLLWAVAIVFVSYCTNNVVLNRPIGDAPILYWGEYPKGTWFGDNQVGCQYRQIYRAEAVRLEWKHDFVVLRNVAQSCGEAFDRRFRRGE